MIQNFILHLSATVVKKMLDRGIAARNKRKQFPPKLKHSILKFIKLIPAIYVPGNKEKHQEKTPKETGLEVQVPF